MPFDPFGDFATRGYLRNTAGETDPGRVRRLEHGAFSDNVAAALDSLRAVPQLRYEHVLQTNRVLFGDLYPWAGQDRAALAPSLAIGKAGRYDLFAHPGDVRRAVEYGLDMAGQAAPAAAALGSAPAPHPPSGPAAPDPASRASCRPARSPEPRARRRR